MPKTATSPEHRFTELVRTSGDRALTEAEHAEIASLQRQVDAQRSASARPVTPARSDDYDWPPFEPELGPTPEHDRRCLERAKAIAARIREFARCLIRDELPQMPPANVDMQASLTAGMAEQEIYSDLLQIEGS
jgi:hypothetical protein